MVILASYLHTQRLFAAISICLILSTGTVGFAAFASSDLALGNRPLTPVNPVFGIGWLLVMAASAFTVFKHRSRLIALLTINVIGLVSAVAFIYLSAPILR